MKRLMGLLLLSLSIMIALALVAVVGHGSTRPASARTPTPIHHVVVFYQENHSFKVSSEPPSSKAWIKGHPPDTDDPI